MKNGKLNTKQKAKLAKAYALIREVRGEVEPLIRTDAAAGDVMDRCVSAGNAVAGILRWQDPALWQSVEKAARS